jgi:hypothetical protein
MMETFEIAAREVKDRHGETHFVEGRFVGTEELGETAKKMAGELTGWSVDRMEVTFNMAKLRFVVALTH